MTTTTGQREEKKRKRKLRKALLAFLKRLRKACESYEKISDWNERVKPLEDLIEEYAQDLPQGSARRLKDAMDLKETSMEAIGRGCKILQTEIEDTVSLLPAVSVLGTVLIGALIFVAAAVTVSAVVLKSSSREIAIVNNQCGDITIPSLGIGIPGLSLPTEILNDDSAVASFPGVIKVEVEVRGKDKMMTLWVANRPFSFTFQKEVSSMTFDGVELLDQRAPLNLGDRARHELVLTCQ